MSAARWCFVCARAAPCIHTDAEMWANRRIDPAILIGEQDAEKAWRKQEARRAAWEAEWKAKEAARKAAERAALEAEWAAETKRRADARAAAAKLEAERAAARKARHRAKLAAERAQWKIRPGTHTVFRRDVERPLPRVSTRKAERAWAALGDSPRPAHVPSEEARAYFARVLGSESRQQREAHEAAAVICNRLIEERFPLTDFSEMEYIPTTALQSGTSRKKRG